MSGKTRTLSPKSIWDEASLLTSFQDLGIKKSHYRPVIAKLYQDFKGGRVNHLSEFELPENTPHAVASILNSGEYALFTTQVVRREDSKDGKTTKLLIQLQDTQQVEAVLMRYNHPSGNGRQRTTLCVSSQVGCAMACSFCATGTMGLLGNLFGGEILEQFIWANQVEHIRNVVFMGMGEPLQNYEAVLSAISHMTSSELFALKQDRVTLSTVGIIPRMFQITDQAPFVTLALSLHAPTQEMRERIVPSARQYPLDQLVDAIDYYCTQTKKRMLLEYVMLDDVNCGDDAAHALGKLLQGKNVMMNLIPFNPVLTKAQHKVPSPETVDRFTKIITNEYGIFTTTRREFGQDISGACGQLAVKAKKERQAAEARAAAAAAATTAATEEKSVGEESKTISGATETKSVTKGSDDDEDDEEESPEVLASVLDEAAQAGVGGRGLEDSVSTIPSAGSTCGGSGSDDTCSSETTTDSKPAKGADIEDILNVGAQPQSSGRRPRGERVKSRKIVPKRDESEPWVEYIPTSPGEIRDRALVEGSMVVLGIKDREMRPRPPAPLKHPVHAQRPGSKHPPTAKPQTSNADTAETKRDTTITTSNAVATVAPAATTTTATTAATTSTKARSSGYTEEEETNIKGAILALFFAMLCAYALYKRHSSTD